VRLPPSRDPRQLMHVLEALARLVPMATMAPESLVDIESRDMAFGTTVVLVTCVATAELLSGLQRLQRRGHQPALLLITSGEAHVAAPDGIAAYTIRVEDTQV